MSKCWKCNKEFYSENLSQILCDECLAKIPKTTATTDFVNLLNSEIKDLVDDFSKRKISELEEKLKNAIIPKFKVGQDVWFIWGKSVMSFVVTRIDIEIKNCVLIGYGNKYWYQFEENCFATKEEAEEKLKEMMKSE